MAVVTAMSLVISPVFAQAQESQQPAQSSGQSQDQTQAQSPGQQETPAATPPAGESKTLHLHTGYPDYSKPNPFFPTVFRPYETRPVEEPMLTNAPRITQLIQDGKLMLSLDDAISIALENNLDINVQRFTPWIQQTQLLKAEAGGIPQGGSSQTVVLGSGPGVSFDPVLTSSINWSRATSPVNNFLLSGVGVSAESVTNHVSNYNFGFTQGFHTGTNVQIFWDNQRSSTSSGAVGFNPAVLSSFGITISQPLLNGFGLLPNTRFILEARNSIKISDAVFKQAVMADVTQVGVDYWELVFALENVKVAEAAVRVDQQLYEDNKKQLAIGTMAPLDVLTAESQLASDQQVLVQAQTTKLQDETILLVAITKDPLENGLKGVEVVPTTPISEPDIVENIPLEDAVKEAWQKRPEVTQVDLNIANANIEIRATRNALLPTLNAFGQYSQSGLGGNRTTTTQTPLTFAPDLNAPLVNNMGTPILVGGVPVFTGVPLTFTPPVTTVVPGGLGDALDSMIHYNFPTAVGGVNFNLPIRNRSAQADNARAQLDQRQLQMQRRQALSTIVLGVHNAMIGLTQGRASVAAATKAKSLAAQTLLDEQKKYQLGTSTSYNVVLRSRDLTSAEGVELRDRINLVEAALAFNQAMGRTLEANRIVIADARGGSVKRDPLIPGEPNWDATPGQK
jgi:outer membrane protein TolC